MKHLQMKIRGGDGAFVYRTGEVGEVIAVEVYYLKTDNLRRRGIYVNVQPQTLSEGRISFVLTSGIRVLAVQTARKSDKVLMQVAARVDEIAPYVAGLVQDGKQAEAQAFLQGMFQEAA
jgi:hypothetical protein